jgi:predicted phage replisome organizer
MFDNRKIRHLRRLPDGNNIVLIWVMLLTMAGRCNSNGMIFLTENIPYTPKMLADELDFEENTVILALQALEQLSMVVTDMNGFFSISGWGEYQNIEGLDKIREQNRLRKQKQRESRKLLQGTSQDSHVTVTGRHATDIEEEKEKEEELDAAVAADEFDGNDGSNKLQALEGELGKGVVFLTDEQVDSLLDKLGLDGFDRYVERLANFIIKNDAQVANHYATILKWVKEDTKV